MKILLLKPISDNYYVIQPNLGLGYLATIMLEAGGSVHILDSGNHGSHIQVLLQPALAEYLNGVINLSFVCYRGRSRARNVGGELEGVGLISHGIVEYARLQRISITDVKQLIT